MAIKEGDRIPDVTLTDSEDKPLALRDHTGEIFVLYFYPKDDTSGCTREAQDFSALLPEFQAAGARILGVSKDSAIKHQKFIAKYDLTISLATDADGSAMEAFGVWVESRCTARPIWASTVRPSSSTPMASWCACGARCGCPAMRSMCSKR